MAMPLRIELSGGLYHVTSRGDRREVIYLDDSDRVYWLALLGHVCKRFNWVCHAYCLMDDHYHIAAYQTGDYTMKEIADAFGLHYATVSRIAQ